MIEVAKGTLAQLNGPTIETRVIRFGPEDQRRSVETRPLDIVDQWKIARVGTGAESRQWRYMTFAAFSLVSVDGKPANMMQAQPTFEDIEARLKQMGTEGLNAVFEADAQLAEAASEDASTSEAAAQAKEAERKAQVGNSSESALSAT